MKHLRPFLIGLLAAAFPLSASVLAQEPLQGTAQQPTQISTQPPGSSVQIFSGKIIKTGDGKYVLQDPATKDTDPPFALDDQEIAKKYKGKSVIVRGTLDSSNNTIHVKKITQG